MIHALNTSGAQKVLVDTVNSFDFHNYDIIIHLLYNKGELLKLLDSRVKVKAVINFKSDLLVKLYSFFLRRVIPPRLIYMLYVKNKYDYEVSYLEGETTKIIANSTNIQAVKIAWIHTDFSYNFTSNRLYKNVEEHRQTYKKFHKVVCVSEAVKKGFIDQIGDTGNLLVKYNIISEKSVLAKAHSYCEVLKPSRFLLVAVGRLEPTKSYERMLKVAEMLSIDKLEFELWIIGQGSQKESLQQYIDDHHLQNFVKLLGFKENPYTYMKFADLYISSSIAEGYSTVVTEAAILGIPIVTTNTAGMNEILENGKYGIITENNVQALYKGTKEMITDSEKYLFYKSSIKERSNYFRKSERMKDLMDLFT
jgi:glycosyltransferase involved in cell wall biosynthesis